MNTEDNNTAATENKNWQGNDKDPEEEKKKGEPVSKEDLAGKKVDADPAEDEGKPTKQ